MSKLIAAWATALIISAVLAYKVMAPKQTSNAAEFNLATVQTAIANQYKTVDHLSPDEFMALDKDNILIFDTRPSDEYNVSHIKNAVQIDPAISAAEFIELYGNQATGKTLVFYCSVGVRSSAVASRVAGKLLSTGAIYNLRGGVFGWHNERRPLANENGAADNVHPYNKKWGQLVTRQDKLSYD